MAKIGKRLKAGLAAVDRNTAYSVVDAVKLVKRCQRVEVVRSIGAPAVRRPRTRSAQTLLFLER